MGAAATLGSASVFAAFGSKFDHKAVTRLREEEKKSPEKWSLKGKLVVFPLQR